MAPAIPQVRGVRHEMFALKFADGLRGEVADLDRMCGPGFDDARTPEGFAKVEVDAETGTVIPLLMSAPGIGRVLAFTIAAEIGRIERFPSPEKLAGYTGLGPRVNQSATRIAADR